MRQMFGNMFGSSEMEMTTTVISKKKFRAATPEAPTEAVMLQAMIQEIREMHA